MTYDVDVEPDDLRAHATSIDAIRDRIANIRSAMDSVEQDNEAYGIICQFLPPVLANRQEAQQRLTDRAEGVLERLANAVRQTADDYESAEDDVTQSMNAIERRL